MYYLYFSYPDGEYDEDYFESEFDAHVTAIKQLEKYWPENWEPGNCQLFVTDLSHKASVRKTLNYLAECRDKGLSYPRYFRRDRWGAVNIVFVEKLGAKPAGCGDKLYQELLDENID